MKNITDELTRIIEKLDSIPANNKHWDATVKSKIQTDIKEATVVLLKLKELIGYARCGEAEFIKMVKAGDKKLVRVNIRRASKDDELYLDTTKEEFFKLWTDSENAHIEFMGDRLDANIYWEKDDVLSDTPIVFALLLNEN